MSEEGKATGTYGAIEVASETYRLTQAPVTGAPISIVPTNPRVYWSELRSLVHSKPVDMEAVEGLIDLAPVEMRHELRVYARANGWKSPKDERLEAEAFERDGQDDGIGVFVCGSPVDLSGVEGWIDLWPSHEGRVDFMNPREQASYTPLTEWDSSLSTPLEDLMAAMGDLRRSSYVADFCPEAVMWTGYSREMELVGEEERFDMPITVNPEVEGDFTITFGWEEE